MEVRLAGTTQGEQRTDLHVEGRNPPEGGELSEDRPSTGWSTSAWYRVTKPGSEKSGTLCPSFSPEPEPCPILLQYDYSKLGIFDIYQV
jgi:hypothetical protein